LISTLNELGIGPTSSGTSSSSYTEFRTIQAKTKADSKTASSVGEETAAELEDRLLVTFNDEPGQHTIVISKGVSDPTLGIYSSSDSVGKQLLGAMAEDEISIPFGDKIRTATIIAIEKRRKFT
jgi:hypothetical protein